MLARGCTSGQALTLSGRKTVSATFSLGSDQFSGPFFARDVAVLPGSPGSVAVLRTDGGVVVYDEYEVWLFKNRS